MRFPTAAGDEPDVVTSDGDRQSDRSRPLEEPERPVEVRAERHPPQQKAIRGVAHRLLPRRLHVGRRCLRRDEVAARRRGVRRPRVLQRRREVEEIACLGRLGETARAERVDRRLVPDARDRLAVQKRGAAGDRRGRRPSGRTRRNGQREDPVHARHDDTRRRAPGVAHEERDAARAAEPEVKAGILRGEVAPPARTSWLSFAPPGSVAVTRRRA